MHRIERPACSRALALAWLAVLVVCAGLTLRNGGIIPFVFADEQYYSLYARLAPMASAILPDYVYFSVFRATLLCGDGFIDCVRGLNVVFFVASAPFLYFSARRIASRFASGWITLLAIAGPLNSYTVYFMPEAMYFFAFWVVSWIAAGTLSESRVSRWIVLGALLGLMAMIKPHALFLLPAFSLFAIYLHLPLTRLQIVRVLIALSALIGATIAVKFAVGYLLVGRVGLTFFGNFYSGVATTTANHLEHYVTLLGYAGISVGAHCLAVVLALGLAVIATIGEALPAAFRPAHQTGINRVSVYSVLVIGSLVGVVALYTGSLALSDSAEIIRLHQRYYDFALPLLMIVAAGLAGENAPTHSVAWRSILAVTLLGLLGYIFMQQFRGFRPGVLDGPWFAGLMGDSTLFSTVACLMALCTLLWPLAPRTAIRMFLYVALPISSFGSGVMVNRELAQHLEPTVYEKAGKFARDYVPAGELGQVVVVCANAGEGFRVLFSVDDARATFQMRPENEAYDWQELPDGKTWVLSIGSRAIPADASAKFEMPGFTLARMPRR